MTTKTDKSICVLKIAAFLAYILMIAMNALANIIPINGITTGEVSNMYPNLFAPAGFTFAIWGIIYFLLACYVLYQSGIIKNTKLNEQLILKANYYFIISSIANALWIIAWHYDFILLSVVLMLVILFCLIFIALEISKADLRFYDKLFIRLPFFVYFGWITIATIANITTLLVSLNWNGFGIPEQIWTIVILIVGLAISILTILKFKDIPYGIVIMWAYFGILMKHISASGFNKEYPGIIITVAISLALLATTIIYTGIMKIKKA